MKGFKIGLFVAISIACLDSSLSQQITCKETITFERGERGIVSCQYNMNFIAVFWYRGDAGNPFLRLEEGRPTTSERFSIARNGTMIIESVEIRDEGVYRISVLDENGVSISEHLYVKVTVSLSTAPVIENCATSESELCQNIKEENRENVLVCETMNTRPKVNLTWWRLSSSGDSYMSGLSYNASMNQSTELFTSSSVFQFEPKRFSVGYFTCKATGEAVRSQKTSSLFVQGLKETAVKTKQKEIVEFGMTLELSCSDKTNPLMSWSFTQDDVTVQTLQTIYPGKRSGACLLGTVCYVDDHGTLTVEEVTHKNEGFYECLYSDGDTSSKSAYEIDILNINANMGDVFKFISTFDNFTVKPIPEEIVIEGCKNSTKCDKAVALTGNIEASVHRARPPVEILCGVADESTAFIYNHESSIEDHPEEGTFDTFYSVDVDIDECSQPVHISCMVPHGSVHENLPASNIYLITDTSSCSNQKGPWTAIILVILILAIIVTVITVLYFKRDRGKNFYVHMLKQGSYFILIPLQAYWRCFCKR
ncbi:hypothetical protein HOLleu_21470 [Holothuria leucospilota]|uniref:Ig-like domain-containing protein n=1 Tax=Holothuria leucospilota TaxID=206669 RepID=A0A9Q1H624_HOLLE|nr:hypothetical protein HOLleu_21470 [Holothuria leucospilota]